MSTSSGKLSLAEAYNLSSAGRLKEAEVLFRSILDEDPDDEETPMLAKLGLANCTYSNGRYHESFALAANIIVGLRRAGQLALAMSEPRMELLGKAMLLAIAASMGMAVAGDRAVEESRDLLAACSELEEVVDAGGNESQRCVLFVLKAWIFNDLGELQRCLDHLDQAAILAAETRNPEVLAFAGVLYVALSQTSSALKVLGGALSSSSPEARAAAHMGLAIENAESDPPNRSGAIDNIRKACDLAESCEIPILRAMAFALYADIAGEQGRWNEVLVAIPKLNPPLSELILVSENEYSRFTGDLVEAICDRLPWRDALKHQDRSPLAREAAEEIMVLFREFPKENARIYADLIDQALSLGPPRIGTVIAGSLARVRSILNRVTRSH